MPVTVRPFVADDLEAVIDAFPPEWDAAGCAPGEVRAMRRLDLAHALGEAPYRLVAELDGRVAGVLLEAAAPYLGSDAEYVLFVTAPAARGSGDARLR